MHLELKVWKTMERNRNILRLKCVVDLALIGYWAFFYTAIKNLNLGSFYVMYFSCLCTSQLCLSMSPWCRKIKKIIKTCTCKTCQTCVDNVSECIGARHLHLAILQMSVFYRIAPQKAIDIVISLWYCNIVLFCVFLLGES